MTSQRRFIPPLRFKRKGHNYRYTIKCTRGLRRLNAGYSQSIRYCQKLLRSGKTQRRASFFSGSLKRRFPFEEDESLVWKKKPKINAAFLQVSRQTDLAFEDMGILKDAMDTEGRLLAEESLGLIPVQFKAGNDFYSGR